MLLFLYSVTFMVPSYHYLCLINILDTLYTIKVIFTIMQHGKRSKNFTEREKFLLMRVAKEFAHIINNKKTDGISIEEKKQAWNALANKYNAVSETGFRTEKQLHALYDNLKKKARKNMSDDKLEMSKTGRGPFWPKTNIDDDIDDNVLTPNSEESLEEKKVNEYTEISPGKDFTVLLEGQENLVLQIQTPKKTECLSRPTSPQISTESTPKIKILCSNETKNTNINNLGTSLIKIKNQNEDAITSKKLEILEIQKQQELVKLEKTKVIMDIDIELKKVLLEKEKLDLQLKKEHYTS